MSEKYLLAIDGGTQSTKILIFDLKGNVVSQGRKTLKEPISPNSGDVEHPGDDLWESLVDACQEAMAKFNGDVKDIVGVGLCTIRSCRVFLRKDGSLAHPVIDWMDPRAYGPFQFPASDIAYATTTTGYMTHRLTGEFKDTIANCTLRQWPTDMEQWKWSDDDELFRQFNLKRDMMMETQLPGSILGYVTTQAAKATGMPQGIPVVATASDKAVEALGAGLSQSGNTGLVSLGTYISSMVCGQGFVPGADGFWTNFASVPNNFLYESLGIRRGMWTVSWIKDILGDEVALKAQKLGISPEEYLGKLASETVPPGCQGLVTVMEWLCSKDVAYKKGIMLGFDVRHTAAHMYRSILEGIALTMKNRFDDMAGRLGINPDKMIISGGGSNGDLFMQIFADVFGKPALRNEINGAAGVGAAICAAVGTGMYKDFDEATQNMVRIKDEFLPNMENHELYTRLNTQVYRDLTQHTDEVMKKLEKVFI